MAIYPYGTYRPLTIPNNDPPIIVIGAILHVAASTSKSLYGYFNSDSAGGIESHFFTRWDGHTEQYRNTGYEADANLKANSFLKTDAHGVQRRYGYVSIETQGLEPDQWTDAQITEIKRLLGWLSREHNFVLQRVPEHTKPGVGYHVMFGAPGPWTPVAKSCPGPARIRQFNNILVPWMDSLAQTPTPTPEELPMAIANDILTIVTATAAEVRTLKAAEAGRYADYVRRFNAVLGAVSAAAESESAEVRELALQVATKVTEGFAAADAEDDQEGVLEGQRWAQTQDTANAILAKLDAVVPPKA